MHVALDAAHAHDDASCAARLHDKFADLLDQFFLDLQAPRCRPTNPSTRLEMSQFAHGGGHSVVTGVKI
jgi:hypothetical protein